MNWREDHEEEETEFEWRGEEDEEEAPPASGRTLSRLNPVASALLLFLVVLFVGSLLFRVVMALRSAGG